MTRTFTRRRLPAMLFVLAIIPLTGAALLTLIGSAARIPLPIPQPADTAFYRCASPSALDSALRAANVPFPETFVKVAIYETGWHFTEGVGTANNVFGMRCSNRVDSCLVGTDGDYSIYHSRMHAVRDLKVWADIKPPAKGMDCETWLKSRGWNDSPIYWDYITTIEP